MTGLNWRQAAVRFEMSLDNGGNIRPDAAIEVGKPIAVDLMDGTSVRGFVHAHDKAATLVCLELIPSAELALISTLNVKSVLPLKDITSARIWPSNRAFFFFGSRSSL